MRGKDLRPTMLILIPLLKRRPRTRKIETKVKTMLRNTLEACSMRTTEYVSDDRTRIAANNG